MLPDCSDRTEHQELAEVDRATVLTYVLSVRLVQKVPARVIRGHIQRSPSRFSISAYSDSDPDSYLCEKILKLDRLSPACHQYLPCSRYVAVSCDP